MQNRNFNDTKVAFQKSHKKVSVAPQPLSMKRNMLWNSVGSFIRTACNWLLTVVVVRLSDGYAAAGALALAMSIVNFVTPFADFKLRVYAVTDINDERPARNYIGIRILTTVVAYIASLIYTLATCDLHLFSVISIYTASQLILTFGEGYRALQQRKMRMDYIGISYTMQGIFTLIFFSLVLYFTDSLLAAVTSLVFVSAIITFAYDMPKARSLAAISPAIDWKDAAKLLLKIFPLVIVATSLNVVALVPRQFLASLYGHDALGIYGAVAAPVIVVQVAAGYITYPLIGRVTELFHTNKRRARTIQLYSLAAIAVIAVVCSLLFFFFGEEIFALIFGDSIREYTYLIQPALFLSFITAITWYTNDLLFALRDFKGCFIGGIAAGIVTLVTTIPLTKLYRLNGPSAVGICAYVCALIVMMGFYIRDYQAIPQQDSNIKK